MMRTLLTAFACTFLYVSCSKKNGSGTSHHIRYEITPVLAGSKATSISYLAADGNMVHIASSNNVDSIPLPWAIEVVMPSGHNSAILEETYHRADPTSSDLRRIYVDGELEMEAHFAGSMQCDF
jgi:hypothetical protein